MKFNKQWLDTFVSNDLDVNALSDMITMAGLEVDSISDVAASFDNVVVASVLTCEDHPDSDHLHVTTVDVGNGEIVQIVCGAPNCRAGLKVACAKVGASLPGIKIKKAKLRGVESNGMLCSYRELGMSEDHDGIIELPQDAPVGVDFREYMQLNDHIVDVDLTSNRPDCLSLRGMARETAVLLNSKFNDVAVADVANTIGDVFDVKVSAKEQCPRYLTRIIKGVNQHAASPIWLKERLRRCGIRSVSPIVDVTNYVMLELGQPLHSFDLDKLDSFIDVRLANKGESLEVLSGQKLELSDDTLVISDKSGPIALAGIFGGLHSGINNDTQNVLLESAYFSPLAIKGRARAYGLNTDASHRFERGVDYQIQRQAIQRATELLVQIAGGSVGPIVEVCDEASLPKSKEVTLRHDRLVKILGADIDYETCYSILDRLGFNPNKIDANTITAVSPSFRFDIEIEEDLIEEVARIYGYNNIENKCPVSQLVMPLVKESNLELMRLKELLVARSYCEAITYSFTDPKILTALHAQEPLVLEAPISSEMSAMRTTLVASLLSAAKYNANRQQKRVRLFESGLRYILDEKAQNGVRQEMMLSGVIMGDANDEIFCQEKRAVDFYDIKGDVESLLALTAKEHDFSFVKTTCPYLHPGQGADLVLDGKVVGVLGALHPVVQKELGIKGKVCVFEIELEALATRKVPVYEEISKFPSIRRDFAVVVDKHISSAQLVNEIYALSNNLVTDVKVFDVFESESLGQKRSIAIAITMQDTKKTLEDAEIDALCSSFLEALSSKFNATLRQ